MSRLRPELVNGHGSFTPSNGTAYLMVFNAVKSRKELVHGRLHKGGQSCAIGSFFDVNSKCALPSGFIDEVAAVNDSVPKATPKQRRVVVMRWLRWKLAQLQMPGFTEPRQAKTAAKRKVTR